MKFLREPLVHFLLIGAALFGLFAFFGTPAGEATPGKIIITPGLIENLKLSYVRSAGSQPTDAELQKLIADYVREEIFDREAYARGIDKDDPAVRQVLRKRMEDFYEDSAQTPAPTDDELHTYLQQHPDNFKTADGRVPDLAAIHQAVQDAWVLAQRKAALDAVYQKLRARYTVVLPPPAAPTVPGAPTAPAKP